jgi:hypothetical protein
MESLSNPFLQQTVRIDAVKPDSVNLCQSLAGTKNETPFFKDIGSRLQKATTLFSKTSNPHRVMMV